MFITGFQGVTGAQLSVKLEPIMLQNRRVMDQQPQTQKK